jgi:hypothetical protein
MEGLKWLKGKFVEFAGPPVFINDLRLTERYGTDIAKVFVVQKDTYARLKMSIEQGKELAKMARYKPVETALAKAEAEAPDNDDQKTRLGKAFRKLITAKAKDRAILGGSDEMEKYEVSTTAQLVLRQVMCVVGSMDSYQKDLSGMQENQDNRNTRKAAEAQVHSELTLLRAKMNEALNVEQMSAAAYQARGSSHMVEFLTRIETAVVRIAQSPNINAQTIDLGGVE